MTDKNEKSLLQIQLENEARSKEILEKDQIFELNKAMIEGKNLNEAARKIFGPAPDQKPKNAGSDKEPRVKIQKETLYNNRNYQ